MKHFKQTASLMQRTFSRLVVAGLLASCLVTGARAQYDISIEVVEEHMGLIGGMDLSGYTTYRMYVETEHPTDFVSAVFGDQGTPLDLAIIGGELYNCEYANGCTADGVNPAFYPFFPQLEFDSWVTIGIDKAPVGSETMISTVASPSEPWVESFASNASVSGMTLASPSGGVWYVLNGSPNGIAGEDNRVLIAQLTTNGTLSGTFNVQVFPEGNGQNEFIVTRSFLGSEVWNPATESAPADCPGALNCVPDGTGTTVCDYPFFFGNDESDFYGPDTETLDGLTAEAGTLPAGVPDSNMSTYIGVGSSGAVSSILSFYTPNDASALTNVTGTSYTAVAGFAPDGAGGTTEDASWSAVMYLDLGGYSFSDLTVQARLDFDPAAGNDPSAYFVHDVSAALEADAAIGADTTNSFVAVFTWSDAAWAASGDPAVTDYPFSATEGGEYGFQVTVLNACDEVVMEHAIVLTAIAGGEGCMVPGACNYDPTATIPGACDYFSCIGCTDAAACNYEESALYNDGSCEYTSCIQFGCTVNTACNYNPEATTNDGSCDFTSCVGCTNPDATNFDPDATIDSGQCTLPGCVIPTACNYDAEATVSDGSCEYTTCLGCMNALACNYDPEATLPSPSTCVFPAANYDCAGACLEDTDGDGVCDPLEVAGCTDPTAVNFDPAATDDDGSCGSDGSGCVIPSACNYDPLALVNDGSCEFVSCLGCTDAMACNYDADATLTDNTQCTYPQAGYDCAGNCAEDQDGDGVCDAFEVLGCDDDLANNYSASATENDGSCTYDPLCSDPAACNYSENWGYCVQVDTVAVHTGMVGTVDLTGFTTYRVYALCNHPDDFVSGVFGDSNAATVISSSTAFYQDAFGAGLASGINASLLPFFPAVEYDSWVTIGLEGPVNAGAGEGPVNVIAGPTNPWLANFEAGGDIVIDDVTGGGWFNLQGVTNGVAGDDLRVLLGQFTTDGTLSGEVFIQFFDYTGSGVQDISVSVPLGGNCQLPQLDACEYPESGYACDGSCLEDTDGDGICDANEVPGCLDPMACNYNAAATEDAGGCTYAEPEYTCSGSCLTDSDGDGVCDAFEVAGCSDANACNYEAAATDDDGSCSYAAPGYTCSGACLLDSDGDGVCDWLEVAGCQDAAACNYAPGATDPGACTYAQSGYDCSGACLNDSDLDGVCDEFEVAGCTDALACNFTANATDDNGSCTYPEAEYGCDGNCLSDVDGDGICDAFEIAGCTDAAATNYDAAATDDNGTCEYPVDPCDPDVTAPTFVYVPADSTITCDQDMPTELAIAVDACDAEVQVSYIDGPIEYILPCAPFNYFCTRTFTATDDAGNTASAIQYITVVDTVGPEFILALEANLLIDEALGQTLPAPAAFVQDACDLTASWTSEDVTLSSDAESTVIQRTYTATDACGNTTVFDQTITVLHAAEGCTDATACNYDPTAEQNDGSCTYAESGYDCSGACLADADGDGVCDAFEVVGCTAENACDYDPAATDEGPCDFCSCNGDAPAYGLEIEVVAVHTEGVLAGKTTYRMYATTANADDFVSAVFGNSEDPLEIATSTDFYQHPGGGALGQAINPMLVAAFPELAFDSWVTIGLSQSAAMGEGEVQTVQGLTPWTTAFEAGNAIALNDELGGLWFLLNGSANGVAGDDHRVLIAQLTTDGELSGTVNVQVFANGLGENELRYPLSFENSAWDFEPIDNACGCTDETAANYDASAEYDDGSCAEPVAGCTDLAACNFDAVANTDDGSCTYPDAGYGCDGACLEDADGDGVCDEFEVLGCTDATALNYNPSATDEDGSCLYPVGGCTDPEACNYAADATEDDGSCAYAEPEFDCAGNCLADADGDGVCDAFEVPGCTDAAADNYNPDATDDDGSCYTCDVAVLITGAVDATCFDSNDGAFTLEVTGSANPSFTWLPALGTLEGSAVTGLPAGTYTVTATDDLGCIATADAVVGSPEPLLIDAVVSDISCNGGANGAIQVFANGGTGSYTFAFDCTNFGPEDTFVGLEAGAYTVCVEDAAGCSATWSGDVFEPEALTIVVDATEPDLNGEGTGSIAVTVAGGTPDYAFAWTGLDGAFQSADEDVSGLAAGTYSLTVTDDNGCQTTFDGINIDAVGISEALDLNWALYPNPTHGDVTIELAGWVSTVTLEVYDGAGRQVWNEVTAPWSGARTWDFGHLPAGWYVFSATTAEGTAQARLLIQR